MFSKKFKLETETEKKIYKIVKDLCDKKEARTILTTYTYYINLEEEKYSVMVSGRTVIVVNSDITYRDQFRTEFCTALAKIIRERANKDIAEIKLNIENRELSMLDRIINKLSGDSENNEKEDSENDQNFGEVIIHG